jgi:hypothetical protein
MPRRHPKPSRAARGPQRPAPREDLGASAEQTARRRAVCASKARYDSAAQARAFALMHNPGAAGPRVATYECEICGGWHFTRG